MTDEISGYVFALVVTAFMQVIAFLLCMATTKAEYRDWSILTKITAFSPSIVSVCVVILRLLP